MRYLLLVGHGRFAEGLASALTMLVGEREWLCWQQMDEGTGAAVFEESLRESLAGLAPTDECVILADIFGGAPAKVARAVVAERLGPDRTVAFAGVNLPMALSAVMAIEDGLDLASLADALLAEGTQALRDF